MLVTNALVIYKCANCNIPYTVKFTPTGDVVEVVNNLDKHKQCVVCNRRLEIISATFKIMDNKYGDDGFGSWRCPTHLAFIYYPAQLRKAVEGGLHIVSAGKIHYERYLKIAATERPWRCPLCGKQLLYTDERRKYAY